jgi:hypothetical protein
MGKSSTSRNELPSITVIAVVWFCSEYDAASLEFEALTTPSSTIIPDNRILKFVKDITTALELLDVPIV